MSRDLEEDDVSASDGEAERPPRRADDGDSDGSGSDLDEGADDTAHHRRNNANVLTSEEDAIVRDAGDGGLAALLHLEVEELLAETRVAHGGDAAAECVERLSEVLMAIGTKKCPSDTISSATHAQGFASSLLGGHPAAAEIKLLRPVKIEAIGSYATGTMTRPDVVVDVAVVMPSKCFHEKDQLNHRYHTRRALYLAALQGILQGSGLFSGRPEVSLLHHDPRRPCLVLRPKKKSQAGLSLRLLAVPEPGTFPPQKLAPGRNNLRSAAKSDGKAGSPGAPEPTPVYNAGILADLTCCAHTEAVKHTLSSLPAAKDAIMMLKVWARQRGWLGQPGAFSGLALATVVLRLGAVGILHPAMSRVQVFRAVLSLLADGAAGWQRLGAGEVPGAGPSGLGGKQDPPQFSEFAAVSPIVLVDSTGWVNLLAGSTSSWAQEVASLASASLKALNTGGDSAFTAVFMQRYPLTAIYDHFSQVEVPEPSTSSGALDADVPAWRLEEQRIEGILRKGLSSRALLVRVLPRSPKTDLKRGVSSAGKWGPLRIAVQVNGTEATRLVDVGPAADNKAEAAKFRQFWGELSELRRFKDGSISEAVVWECPASERHLIIDRLVTAVLERHCPGSSVLSPGAGLLDGALVPPADAGEQRASAAQAVASGRALEAAADRLSKQLRSLDEVKPGVVMVQPIASALRHTAEFQPAPNPLAGAPGGTGRGASGIGAGRCLEPVEVLVQLEGSGSWPEDGVDAFRQTKAAVGVQLAEALATSYNIPSRASLEHVDVFVDGFAFRLVLSVEREPALMRRLLGEAAVLRQAPSTNTGLRQWHHGAAGLVDGQHPAYAPTVRLAKRWLSSSLMEGVLAEEAVELLVAQSFCCRAAASAPGSRLAGLLRFLRLLATHEWQHVPLIVDPHKEITDAQARKINDIFEGTRSAGSNSMPAMFLATSFDPASLTWTRESPTGPQVSRLRAAAARTAALLEAAVWQLPLPAPGRKRKAGSLSPQSTDDAWAKLLAPVLDPFDAVLTMRKESLPANAMAPSSRRQPLPEAPSTLKTLLPALAEKRKEPAPKMARAVLRAIPPVLMKQKTQHALQAELLVGFDPVRCLVAELRARYAHLADFCSGGCLERVVAVKWKAQAFLPGALRVPHAHTVLPRPLTTGQAEAQASVVVDVAAALAEMQALGEGLVADVLLLDSSHLL